MLLLAATYAWQLYHDITFYNRRKPLRFWELGPGRPAIALILWLPMFHANWHWAFRWVVSRTRVRAGGYVSNIAGGCGYLLLLQSYCDRHCRSLMKRSYTHGVAGTPVATGADRCEHSLVGAAILPSGLHT